MLKRLKLRKYNYLEITVFYILIFTSISFFSFYIRIFSFFEDFSEIKIGFPFQYFHEYRIADRQIETKWNYTNLIFDNVFSLILTFFDYKLIRFQNIKNRGIISSIFLGTLYSILLFFSTSFVGLINGAMKFTDYQYKIGFPIDYYEQFWVSGNYFPNHGTSVKNLLFSCCLFWTISLIFIFLYRLYQQKKS